MPRIRIFGIILSFVFSFILSACPGGEFSDIESNTGSGESDTYNASSEMINDSSPKKHLKDKAVKPLKLVTWSGKFSDEWKKYDKLVGEQKYEAASKLIERIAQKAQEDKNTEEMVRCLIRRVMLRISLHGYGTAVRYFSEQPWPEDLLSDTVLRMYYANTLITYAYSYSWEIRKREKVDTKGKVDLKAWTMEQIYEEALRSYGKVWAHRQQLGHEPIKHLADYINENNYPRKIRPSLRDAVSYQLYLLLSDTSFWRPEHTNGIYQLDLKSLLGQQEFSTDQLADSAVHPLVKICGVLDDLETWHASRGEKEAALEARLARLRVLYQNFKQAPDRKTIKQDLIAHLDRAKNLEWWSVGQALLAEFVRQENTPDNLIRARRIAIQCQKPFGDSIGAQRCLNIQKSIEMPEYSLEAISSDSPEKESILVKHKNLKKLYFRAYFVDLKKHIEKAHEYNLFLEYRGLNRLLKNSRPSSKWAIDLESTPDYKMHKQFATPPMKRPGFYVIMASAFEDFRESSNKILGINMVIGDLVMVSQNENDRLRATMISGSSGKPMAGVKVHLYMYDWNKGHKSVAMKVTGEDGEVTFQKASYRQYFLFAQKGNQVAMDPNYIYMYPTAKPQQSTASLIYTDRSIYRPMQKIRFKTVVYRGRHDLGNYRTLPNYKLVIKLMDANYQKVKSKTLVTNSFGTASGQFTIPRGRLLGNWRLQTSPTGYAYLKVEEYKRPTFEVKLKDSKEPLRLNRPVKLTGEARYYFGLPVADAKVKWRVRRTPVYPWWWGWYYYGGYQSSGSQVVATGYSPIAHDGTFDIKFTPKADERLSETSKEMSYRYKISVDVTDEGGETRSASRTFRLGFVAVEASMIMDTKFFLEDQKSQLTIMRTNLDGNPSPGKGQWQVFSLKSPEETLLPAQEPLPQAPGANRQKAFTRSGDKKRPRWNAQYSPEAVMHQWADGQQVIEGRVVHDDKGAAVIDLPPLPAGAYRLRYKTKDAYGAEYEMSREFLVAGRQAKIPLPGLFKVERSSVKVGQTARVFLLSGLDAQTIFYEIHKDSRRIRRQLLVSGNMPTLIEIPVTEKDRGGFGLTFWLVRDHQYINFNQSVFVPWDNKELKLEFSSFRDRLRPGQEEKWTIKVKGPSGTDSAASSAELLAYMYDRSLDSFTAHSYPTILGLFPNHSAFAWARTNLGPAYVAYARASGWRPLPGYPSLQGDYFKYLSGYGVGGPGRRGFRRYRQALAVDAPPESGGDKEVVFMNDGIMDEKSAEVEAPKDQADADLLPTASSTLGGSGFGRGQAARELKGGGGVANKAKEQDSRGPQKPVQVRANFTETAFFQPHLLANKDGSASIQFTVPDSVTSWNVYVHAITRDLKSGTIKKEAKSVKDLMVRPYLPRFLREGDQATIKVVVNNASKGELKGKLDFDIIDPDTKKSLLAEFGLSKQEATGRAFTIKPDGGTDLAFDIKTPTRVGLVAFKVIARSGDFSDGELRPIPILPGRMHLVQSRFVTLKNKDRRVMTFEDMEKDDDPTLIQDQMVITIDTQLFYSVLTALPYLVNYPYECTEQLLNRFLSTGIMSSLYDDYPAIKRMAKRFSRRKTEWETFNEDDPNRKMALEETPWVQESQGGYKRSDPLINVLDPRIAKAFRDSSLAKLKKAQTSIGAFPWFPGGRPSPYMTLYLLHGFSKALEFGVDVPKNMIRRAWGYMHRHYINQIVREMMANDAGWEFVSFLNYVLSNYPDMSWTGGVFTAKERKTMLDFSFRHWKQHSPYLKGYLALTLHRMNRDKDARLVWESVMDSAKEKKDQGVFWAPEDRSWLWYNDTIETHAFAVRTLLELLPSSKKLDGLVLWLFLNKKMNHWKSTRATSEVIYSLAKYLKKTEQLATKEELEVKVGNISKHFVFLPDEYTGKKNQIRIPGDKIDPKKDSKVVVSKKTKGFAMASATWHFSTERMPKEARGDFLRLTRKFFKRVKTGREVVLQPLKDGAHIEIGDEVEVHLSISSKHPMEYVHLRDPRPAGFEPVSTTSRHRWNLGIYWYEEVRDSGMNFFFEALPKGQFPFKYRMRAATAGIFKVAPATLQPVYAPEFAAYSSGSVIAIDQTIRK